METIRKEEIQWLSAAIDGEGCIQTANHKRENGRERYRILVELTNTNPYFLRKATEVLCSLGIKFAILMGNSIYRGINHQCLRISILSFPQVEKILTIISPYLTAKKVEAERVLSFLAWRKTLFPEYVTHGRKTNLCTKVCMKPSFERFGEYMEGFKKLSEELKADKKKNFCLQRLPRSPSTPLDLKNLEIVEEMV